MIRAFVAFDIDCEQMHRRFLEVQDKLVETGADLKTVKPRNIHVTMRFLGNVSPHLIEQVYEEMKKVYFNPFSIKIKGIGAFPSLNYIRVVWAGVERGVEQLRDVFNQLEPAFKNWVSGPIAEDSAPT